MVQSGVNTTSSQYKIRTIEWFFKDARKEYPEVKIDARKKITSPSDVYDIFKDFFINKVKEHFAVVWLNATNKVIGWEVISIGDLTSSVVGSKEVFRGAIVSGASSLILLHNHPSGNIEPSNEDISITRKLVEVGKVVGMPVYDHLIITYEGYTSFVEKRLI